MNSRMRSLAGCGLLAGLLAVPATAQSVGRIRRSLDKATGGATAAPASGTAAPAATSPSAVQAQAAANDAAAKRRNQASQVGVEDRVVTFLKERVEDGSADAAFDLAKRYEEGKGVTADPAEARRLYALSAERGNEEAKTWLAEHPEPEGAAQAATDGKPAVEKSAAAESAEDATAATPAAPAEPAAPSEKAVPAVPATPEPKP